MRFRDILLEYDRQVSMARWSERLRQRLVADRSLSYTTCPHGAVYAREAYWAYNYELKKPPGTAMAQYHMEQAKNALPKADADLARAFETVDPTDMTTKQYPYIGWMIQRYLDNGIERFEDMNAKVKPWLAAHHRLKETGWFKRNPDQAMWADIGRFKTLSQLGEFILPHLNREIESASESRRKEEERIMTTEVKTVLDTPTCSVRIPLTWEAAKILGRNTQWCTSGQDSDAYFRSYTSNAPLYVILDKKNNRRWQFYFGPRDDGAQLMDERDESIDDFSNIPDEALNIELYLNDIKEMSIHHLEELTDWRGPGGRWDGVILDIIEEKIAEEGEMGGWQS